MKLHRARTESTRSRLLLSDHYLVQRLESRYLLSGVPVSPDAVSDPLPAIDYLVSPSAAAKPLAQRSPGVTEAMANQAASFAPVGSSASAAPESLEATAVASAVPNSGASTLTGSLAGKVLFTSGGHGYVWRDPTRDGAASPGYWGIMRSYGYNFMEDMGNQDQIQPYADYALHSGATVVPMRPVGHQVNEVLMDNGMGYSASTGGFQIISGSWSGNGVTTPYWSVNNGSDTYHWMFAAASATETAVARYTPNIPVAGFYPVYEWTNPGQDNASNDRIDDQTFRINYTGGSVEVKVAADKVGNGWVYLGTYYFAEGVSGANVEISNKTSGATAGKYVVADGIRFGNGMGDWTEYGAHPVSGYSREDEAALYWCYAMLGWTGVNARVNNNVVDAGNNSSADENKNFFACDRYAAYMNNSNVGNRNDRLWISFHSNGSGSAGEGGAGRGTLGLINTTPTTNQAWLAQTAGETVQQEMVAAGFNWSLKSTPYATGGYAEISNSSSYINGEFDATIIEVAYHDNATDNALLKNPAVRDAAGRASYHTAVKFFQTFDSLTNTTLLPEPPINVRATTDAGGNVTISWDPGPSSSGLSGPYGNAATSYRVHTSTNGYGFDGGVVTTATSLILTGLSTSSPTYFMVTAVNSGGESMNSYVVVAKPQATGQAPILVVNGFSRMDGTSDEIETKSFGTVYRARARYNNSHDYVVQAASSITAYNSTLGFESAPASAISAGLVNLSNYQAVIWLAGEQATSQFTTFDSTTQSLVTSYLNSGGKLFVSGSNVALNLASNGENKGSSFLSSALHATYVRDDANTYNFAAGVAGSAFANVPAGSFDNGTHGTYDVDTPDGISPGSGATAALSYSGGNGGTAAVQYASGNTRVILLAFPLESVYTQSTRDALVAGALNYFGFSATAAPPPSAPDLADASDTGSSSSDNITRRNNSAGNALQFTVPGTIAGALVQLYADGTLIGQATASSTSTTITTNGTFALSNGAHSITAVQTPPGFAISPVSSSIIITVDTVAPTVSFASVSSPRSTALSSESILFSESVAGFAASSLKLTRYSATNLLTASQTLSGSGSSYTLSNLSSLTDRAGLYVLTLTSFGSITDLAGNPLNSGAALSWANNTLAATSGSDAISLVRNAIDPTAVDVTVNSLTYTVGLSNLGSLTIASLGSADSLTLDLSNGVPTFDPSASLILNLDSASSLTILGSGGDDTFTLSDTSASLNGLPVAFATPPAAVLLSGSTGDDTLSLTNRSVVLTSTQRLASLSLAGSSTLDLKDNDLIVTGGLTPEQFRQLLLAGKVFSSAAVADSLHTTAIGYALASDLAVATFAGQSVSPSALLVKYTYLGDGDLDGQVTADDLTRADLGELLNRSSWLWGDANYDGSVTPADLAMIHAAFRDQGLIL